jgi:hypothetical protein
MAKEMFRQIQTERKQKVTLILNKNFPGKISLIERKVTVSLKL